MPLIIITGLPSSGKTYRAQQIREYICHRLTNDQSPSKRSVSVVTSHHAGQDDAVDASTSRIRDEVYNSSAREKIARAEEFSAIKRGTSKDNVVIADCPNYIKGYRYQLWCEAKAAGTRSCVVHVAATEADCRQWNEHRLRAWGREEEIEEQSRGKDVVQDITKHGKDVMGNLMPESHTAVYGDRYSEQTSRSRSSSMDAADGGPRQAPQEDTMTLKSLYISSPHDQQRHTAAATLIPSESASTATPNLPEILLPPPTKSPPYSPSTLTSLSMRYEPPSPFSRWDTPLFTVPTSDKHPPYDQIFDAIFPPAARSLSKKALSQLPSASSSSSSTPTKHSYSNSLSPQHHENTTPAVRQHAATVLPSATSASALQLLESTTLVVVRALLLAARDQQQHESASSGAGGPVTFEVPIPPSPVAAAVAAAASSSEDNPNSQLTITLDLPHHTQLSQPYLQRLRRKFTQLQRGRIAHGQGYVGERDGRSGIVHGFVRFLEGEFGAEDGDVGY